MFPALPVLGDGQAFERGVVADVVGGFAVGDLPEDFASVHVDRGDAAVGGFMMGMPSISRLPPASSAAGLPTRAVDSGRRLLRLRTCGHRLGLSLAT